MSKILNYMFLCVLLLLPAVGLAANTPEPAVRGTGETIYFQPRFFAWAETAPAGSHVWIRFTDHGSAAGTLCPLTDRAVERRLRLGIPLDTPERQPVAPEYIDAIKKLGGKIHRVSRWLNAVSVEYDPDVVRQIAELSAVAEIRPVARLGRRPVEQPAQETVEPREAYHPETAALNYGSSLGQIQQIRADLAHNRGYAGAGVLVAMFDTGYRKDHVAFADAFSEGRVIAEYDFVFDDSDTQNEPVDNPSQHYHGTSTWSTLGGAYPGQVYGPAYQASFLLAKTEDIRSETPVEEDNWLAAVQWADSLGADVISSSLSYTSWYVYADYDGQTAVVTQAANLATSLGIVVANSAGNAGPGGGTIGAPADAFGILTCGSVTSTGAISSFSSRGPTADGRIKPEVCAQGSSTYVAKASSTTAAGTSSGTSFSCPLIGGCAAILIGAHPTWNPLMVREALMQTASDPTTPDNTYGWGIANVNAALDYTGQVNAHVVPLPDTVVSYEAELPVRVVASSLTPIDPASSTMYYRVDSGAYQSVALTPLSGDTLSGGIPLPAASFSTVDYYFVAKDTVGFTRPAPEPLGTAETFIWQTVLAGDLNKDGSITITDIIGLVTFIFKSGESPQPLEIGDVDGNAGINASDVIYLVNYVFKGGPAPTLP